MLVDSHCHLNFPELMADLDGYLAKMKANQVDYAMCIATRPDNIDAVVALADAHSQLFASVGVHPDEKIPEFNLSAEYLLAYTKHPKVVAIGETGLDYYWNKDQDLTWQRDRFNLHIEVAKKSKLPLVVHTRDASQDTWQLLKDGGIEECGAVIHCFTENLSWARQFLDLGCYISFSGIVTFKNASQIQDAARYVPKDRLLVETDAPFLAPAPFRGKLNHPALVMHSAQFIADLRMESLPELAEYTSDNYFNLFSKAKRVVS